MRNANQYWWLITLRGMVALLASGFIVFLPGMMRTIFLMPVAVVFMILALTFYGIADSAVLFVAGFNCTARSAWRRVLWIEAGLGISVGLVLLTLALEKVDLRWFIPFAALQAFTTGFGDLAMARKACEYRTDKWSCYLAGGTAVAAGLLLVALRDAGLTTLMWWLACYIFFFGLSLLVLSSRLWLTRHQHLAEVHS